MKPHETCLVFCAAYTAVLVTLTWFCVCVSELNQNPMSAFDKAGFIVLDREHRVVEGVEIKNGVVVAHWSK